jgi:hypothetical protein
MVQGRQDFNSSKAGKKALKEAYCGPVRRRFIRLLEIFGKHVSLVANQVALGEAQAEARLFPELNEPKRRFSWFKATFPVG